MIYDNPYETKACHKNGDEIWACSHDPDTGRTVPPLKGMLSSGRTLREYKMDRNANRKTFSYFVPYDAVDDKPIFHDASRLSKMCYADTKEECQELYANLLDDAIQACEKERCRLVELQQEYCPGHAYLDNPFEVSELMKRLKTTDSLQEIGDAFQELCDILMPVVNNRNLLGETLKGACASANSLSCWPDSLD